MAKEGLEMPGEKEIEPKDNIINNLLGSNPLILRGGFYGVF